METNIIIPDKISEIARMIERDWKNVYFGARPYLDALYSLNKITDTYGSDSGESVVNYFLCNAKSWRGETARQVKKKLNQLVKNAQTPNAQIRKMNELFLNPVATGK